MMSSRRSASVGALPHEKKHFVSRNESASGVSLDVRCACQYFECESLLPERVNPVDSRPGSKQGFHSDVMTGDLEQFLPMNLDSQHQHHQQHHQPHHQQHDHVSTHSFEIVNRRDVMDQHRPPSVDLSFVEKYPELEHTARSRGLVVRTISDATDGSGDLPGSQPFLAGHRRRQLSVGGMSTGSGRGGYHRGDLETLSMRSGTSLRRISCSNSKADLFVADINIPDARDKQREQRSRSMSRRTSNADLFQATILHPSPAPQQQQVSGVLMPPQLNLITATPSPGVDDMRPDFVSQQRQRSPSPAAPDYRNAKPPLSVDYMRPNENKELTAAGDILPQNRPIDVSRFAGDAVRPMFLYEADYKEMMSPHDLSHAQKPSQSQDPLQQIVAELEDIAALHNIVDIRDNIQTETMRPPSIVGNLSNASLGLAELTKINIVSAVPVVDIDELIQSEEEKAAILNKMPAPPPRRPKSPPIMATLQLPSSRPSSPTQVASQSQLQLKRQHTPERQMSPERLVKFAPIETSAPTNISGIIKVQEASPEVKSSYTSRFKSMFTSTKGQESRQKSPSPQRQKSPPPIKEKSQSPRREKSPSPAPAKLMSIFSKNKPMAVEIVSGVNAVVTKKQEAEPLSVKVTETFSLKVDDMDQYSSRPTKPLSPPPYAQTMYSSREDFAASEQASVDISEAFAPVVVSSVPRGGFFAGNRNLYTSDIDMPQLHGSQADFRGSSREPSMGSRPLISVPINLGGSNAPIPHGLPPISQPPSREVSRSRAPSEQRFGLHRKTSFREPRTQSHDRARITGSQEHLLYASTTRMTKTVSFNFDERKSRLADFESKSPLTQKQTEHRDFLERTYFSRDHEYEPIGVPPPTSGATLSLSKEASPAPPHGKNVSATKYGTDIEMKDVTEEPKDYDGSQMDLNELDEPPLKPVKKGFMASAQDRTRKMQDGLRTQAGKIRTKLRTQPKKSPSSSPKAKERRRFKAPEFSKIKMPELKRPDMSKFKEIKRPEFTKFNKPDMSMFKLPEKFPTLKLRRSKSFKENEASPEEEEPTSSTLKAAPATAEPTQPQKKMFDFNFGTYPRAFRKKKKPVEPPVESSLGTEGLSVIPSTETQPSMESSSSPQGDRGPGPVRSRWADKFSDVSYNDSEGSRYRRYGSEVESFDRESSLERRMKDDLEDTGSEAHDVGILGGVADSKQFAEFDEENRAIHEISNLRSREFKRRPIVHQDSDLRSEDSKDVEGWTEKEIQKNKLLRNAEIEAEASYYKYHAQDAVSTASSGKKVVMEEIDDDEFFLRKRGISEDNIELRQYISKAIREGYEMPNALVNVGQASEEPIEYGDYDVPPPKPRRLHKNYRPEYGDSQEFHRSDYGDDFSMSQNGSDFTGAPKRPLRKGRSRSKYSIDSQSQDIPMADEGSGVQYFDDDEEYLRPPPRDKDNVDGLNNLDFADRSKTSYDQSERFEEDEEVPHPQPPRRRQKKRTRDDASVEKDAFINGFGGRSVSNTFLQPQEDVIVYRTEHEYHIPLATPENYTSRSASRFDEDDRTSRGADSLALDVQVKPEYDQEAFEEVLEEKFVIDMTENDGYATVRKEPVPKPTPPARRKKFTRAPGERFATLPSTRSKRSSPPPARPPPPQSYTPSTDAEVDSPLPPRRRSTTSLDAKPNYEEDDYEEPGALDRPESPRNLQSGEVINKMKFRPLPPPPRPPREKRQTKSDRRLDDELSAYRYEDSERIATSSTADSYDQNPDFEVEVSTQTDPLPDDFICEELEITEDMKVIEPRRTNGGKTLDDLLKAAHEADEVDTTPQLTEDEQLARGLQRFRDANQRSMSERSRASSQADRSKSLSRPQTPSAIVIERRISTPAPSPEADATVEAALIVRPISDADLEDEELRREEEELRREGLLSDSSVQSKSDIDTTGEEEEGVIALSDYAPSSADLDAAVEKLQLAQLDSDYDSKLYDEEVERTLRDSEYEEDTAERYSQHYDEDEEDEVTRKFLEKELEDALEKEIQEEMEKQLQEEMEKELRDSIKASHEKLEVHSSEEAITTPDILSEEEVEHNISTIEEESEIEKEIVKETKAEPSSVQFTEPVRTEEELREDYPEDEPVPPPQAPPRRKSMTVFETVPTPSLTISEQAPKEVANAESIVPQAQLPSRLGDLEVERLRVHALQAGQIMVSQLHGQQISADELECKASNLVVQNIELPPGFIEDIVERVRSTEPRTLLLTTETQTSRQPSSEPHEEEEKSVKVAQSTASPEPPRKPPRQTKLSESSPPHSNLDEETQTEAALLPLPPPPPVYPSVEYLQSLAPLAFYNLQRSAEAEASPHETDRKAPHKCRRRHVQRRSTREIDDAELDDYELHPGSSDNEVELVERPISRRSRTRSGTQPPSDEPKTVAQAGRQFISACSLELVNIINQLTNFVRGGSTLEPTQSVENTRTVPALVVLFMVITFGLLIFLLTGRNVHTHHWDYFNPPGNEGRQT